MTDRNTLDKVAFALWQDWRSADFDLLLANRHHSEANIRNAIEKLRKAADTAEAALAVKEAAE
jgi:hypothetical protein